MNVTTLDVTLKSGVKSSAPMVDAATRALEVLAIDEPEVFRTLGYEIHGLSAPDEVEIGELVNVLYRYGICNIDGVISSPMANVLRVALLPGVPMILNPVAAWTVVRPHRVNETNYFLRDLGGQEHVPTRPRYGEN